MLASPPAWALPSKVGSVLGEENPPKSLGTDVGVLVPPVQLTPPLFATCPAEVGAMVFANDKPEVNPV